MGLGPSKDTKIKLGILTLMGLIYFGAFTLAQANISDVKKTCSDLVNDLKAMQKAQSELLNSFQRKSQSIASTLDIHAENLRKKAQIKGKLKSNEIGILNRSADALRHHQAKEAELVGRFEKASAQLLDQVQTCLIKNQNLADSKDNYLKTMKN